MSSIANIIPIVLGVTVVIIGATWRLLSAINAVDKRVSSLEKEINSIRIDDREWTSRQIRYHRESCRAAQDYITGVHARDGI
jgi:hypothetical protein